jgi:hypothetical protein
VFLVKSVCVSGDGAFGLSGGRAAL